MNPEDLDKIAAPVAKSVALWSLVGFSSLADAASFATMIAGFLAALYSLLLVCEWFWKKLWKPVFTHFGWFGLKRRIITVKEDAAMVAEE
ncbi:MAG: hypothetical protein Q7U63_12070 [Polaromonas sp.]|uniref:hypothetical protein n=1 Tax=Polaromonas sp. TaxID=1869339 RepID=UPI0027215108|nr:hypothetical protein [Polaromonas sp.]MDO9114513.1 hypothetical protein [Polaromonas sp.]